MNLLDPMDLYQPTAETLHAWAQRWEPCKPVHVKLPQYGLGEILSRGART